MKTQEQYGTTSTDAQTSTIHIMDIIPHSSSYENISDQSLKIRHRIGRAAIDKAFGIKFKQLPVAESDPYLTALRSLDLPVTTQPAVLPELVSANDETTNVDEESVVLERNIDESRITKLRSALGKYAALANIKASQYVGMKSPEERKKRSEENKNKFAKIDGQRLGFDRSMRWIKRNKTEIAAWTPVAVLGSIAIERFGISGMRLDNFFEGTAFADAAPAMAAIPEVPQTREMNVMPMVSSIDTIIVAGGAGQGQNPDIAIADMQAKGYDLGYKAQIKGVHYSAEIGPVVGQEKMIDSANGGATDMYNQVIGDVHAGKIVQLSGYSEGTLVAIETYDRIVAENGGVAPDNLLPPILVATPYVQGGIMDNALTGGMVGSVLNGMGIPTDRKLPPGTIVKYYDSDIYANGGNMNTATLMKNALGLGMGTHDIPNEADFEHSFTDSDGVVHMVYSRDDVFITALEKSGIKIMDTESANKAFEAFFPIGKDENGAFLKPDVRAGLTYMAQTLDHQIDPSGNTHVMQDFMAQLPDEWKELGQRGMDGFNNITEMAAKIQSGEVDPLTGFQSIMGSLSSIMGGFQGISAGQNGQSSFMDWSTYSQGAINYSGYQSSGDYSAYMQQMQDLAHAYMLDCAQYVQSCPPPQTPQPYGYNSVDQVVDQSGSYVYETTPQPTAQIPYETTPPAVTTYNGPVTPAPESIQTPAQSTPVETVPPVVTPVREQATPTPIVEQAPVVHPIEQQVPVVEAVPEPAPAPVEQAPVIAAPIVEAPVEVAPTPPPEVYEVPAPAPVAEAPVIETPPPAPIIEAAPIISAPVIPAFEVPQLSVQELIPAPSSPSSSSFFSTNSSSSSAPSLVATAVSE